jgi:protein SCO1/2
MTAERASSGLRRRGVFVLVLVLVASGALLVALNAGDDPAPQPAAGGLHGSRLPPTLDRRPAAAFDLPDARGGRVSSRGLLGRPYALTFVYTQCPDVCPLIGQELKQALTKLGPAAAQTAVVAISVDPRGDTPAAVRQWLRRQRLPARFRYAIGSRGQLEPVWRAYYAAPQLPGRPETSTHSAAVWIVDARGRLRTRYAAGLPVDPGEIASDLRTLLGEARASAPDTAA